MSERGLLLALALALGLASCGPRRVEIRFHVPAYCGPPLIGDGGAPLDGGARGCPLADVRSVETRLVRVDGVVAVTDCVPTPGLCDFDDLREIRFLTRAEPSDGVEIEMTGWDQPACGRADPAADRAAALRVRCESFGDSVVELPAVDQVDVWCDCPLGSELPP